ncbi:anthranilate phosphoribosyltransferase [Virgibacillus kimchii]
MKMYLEKLMERKNLTVDEMQHAVRHCFKPETTESEISAFLTALKIKGETADELTGLVEVIRAKSAFHASPLPNVMDNCGTGGDKSNSFNISTTAAFVIAGAGVPVAKHGNRSISSKAGSADVLEHLGVSLSFSREHMEEALTANNICFLFAPHVHQGLKPFTKVRKNLGLPTIFNIIGPLTNPFDLGSQLIGVYRHDLLQLTADALRKLKRRRAIVLHGAGGMDEASLSGTNHMILLEQGRLTSFTLHPEEIGLPVYTKEQIRGGDAKENAAITKSVLKGEPGPYLDTVLLNAGLGLFANGTAETISSGVAMARESITSGSAMEKLENLVQYSRKIPSEVV